MNTPTPLYYESHVTVEPVTGEDLALLRSIATFYGFRVANLVMLEKDEPNQRDAFCSARHEKLLPLENLMHSFVAHLKQNGYQVYRYKLEATLFDTKEVNHGANRT